LRIETKAIPPEQVSKGFGVIFSGFNAAKRHKKNIY
jgi:hypothetical protein